MPLYPPSPPSALSLDARDYRARWEGRGEQHRRAFVHDLLEMYGCRWHRQLNDRIRRLFLPENAEKLKEQADTSLNLLRWAVDELAGIYARPTVRTVDGEREGLEPYDSATLDLALDQAARLTFACRELILRPLWNARREQIEIDIITPDRVAVWIDDVDPLTPTAIMVQLPEGRGTGAARFVVYTDDRRVYLGANYEEIRIDDDDDDGTNPYGVIPYVLVHAAYPACGVWHESDALGLYEATLEAGVQKTDHNHLRHLQSFKQLFFSGLDNETLARMAADPSTAIYTKNPQASASVLDLQADLQAHLDSLLSSVGATLNLAGIRPEAVKGTMSAESGYALTIKMHKQAVVWEQQRTLWRVWERLLYDVARVVALVDGGVELPEGQLEVEFGEIGPTRDPSEQASLASALQAAGWSVAASIRHVWGHDDEWIEKNSAEKRAESAFVAAAIPSFDPPRMDKMEEIE